ncbi:uncharacterized protein B0I36DRAFT_432341 [Microdochium trichocladiopsis]|uniref:Uncharacterized protein n=1 Tax=Microdochium trichocladiopsis TaxID=1682393 RepID=A0A9P8Y7J2_9PEZI|nr:uncharacterized protein B0I36DRAFT_432341 [Microdochium trichocladiopsis]KAH7029601.1 hypothetical protein B0I36DRAFT_432341 [Microdochium trichocladiopsis]
MRIPAFLRLVLKSIKPDDELHMVVAEEILRHYSTTELSMHLLGFVTVDFVLSVDEDPVVAITGSYKLEHRLILPPSTPTLTAAWQALDEFDAEIEAILQDSMQDSSLLQMDSRVTMDWLVASGFAEDKRDQYYLFPLGGVVSVNNRYKFDDRYHSWQDSSGEDTT